MWGIPWATVQKMMVDAPGYKFDDDKTGKDGKKLNKIKMTEQNADEIMNMFNSLGR